ncbi:hypothetical protein P7K49_027839, partial [Saguinus oedipus]
GSGDVVLLGRGAVGTARLGPGPRGDAPCPSPGRAPPTPVPSPHPRPPPALALPMAAWGIPGRSRRGFAARTVPVVPRRTRGPPRPPPVTWER